MSNLKFLFLDYPATVQNQSEVDGVNKELHLPSLRYQSALSNWLPFTFSTKKKRVIGSGAYHNLLEGVVINIKPSSENIDVNSFYKHQINLQNKIYKAVSKAGKKGACLIGLGGLLSAQGNNGVDIARNLKIPVTNGRSYTVVTSIESALHIIKKKGIEIEDVTCTVIGADSPVGMICAKIMAHKAVRCLYLIANDHSRTVNLAHQIIRDTGISPVYTIKHKKALSNSHLVLLCSHVSENETDTQNNINQSFKTHLKKNAVLCDILSVGCLSREIIDNRDDLNIVDSCAVKVPPLLKLDLSPRFPPQMCCPSLAETLMLLLDGRLQSYSLGQNLLIDKVIEISKTAEKHGFKWAGYFSRGHFNPYN